MTSLIIPRNNRQRRSVDSGGDMAQSGAFVTKSAMDNAAKAFEAASGQDVVQDVDTPIPEGLPDPQMWRVTVMPVRQVVKTRSGLYMPPEYLDTQNWTHMLWKVAKVGPFVYRGPAWRGFTEEELQGQLPKPGDLYLIDPKVPRRFRYKGVLFAVVNDDALWSKVDPDCIDGLQFAGAAEL